MAVPDRKSTMNGEYKFKTKLVYRSILDMTPLVDFAFSLLMFFMMTYNAGLGKLSSIKINLPSAVKTYVFENKDLVISITNKNEVYIGDTKYSIEELVRVFEKNNESFKNKTVIINGDKDAKWNTIVAVVDILSRAGINKLSVTTINKSK